MKQFSIVILVICYMFVEQISSYNPNFSNGLYGYNNFNPGFFRNDMLRPHWPFTPPSHNYNPFSRSSEEVESVTQAPLINPEKNGEPLDVEIISGTINEPQETQFEFNRPNGFPFGPYPSIGDTSSIFQHTFGDIFGGGGLNGGFFGGFPSFGQFPTPWWRGPNVCLERDEKIEDNTAKDGNPDDSSSSVLSETNGDIHTMFVSGFDLNVESCYEKPNKHICKAITSKNGITKTVTTSHKCCHGYARNKNAWNSICEEIALSTISETAEKLGAKEFVKSAISLDVELKKNLTLFVPLDHAFSDFTEQIFESNLVVLPLRRQRRASDNPSSLSSRDIIESHMVEDWINIEDTENEQILKTAYKNATIRINIFPKPPSIDDFRELYRYTANCVPILKTNQLATNGIIHVVEKVLLPTTKTVYEIIQDRSDMTIFRSILQKTKLDEVLKTNKSVTVFAPVDKAFENMDPSLKKLLKEGNQCAVNILKNHILDLTLCSVAVVSESKTSTVNLLGKRLSFERTNKSNEESTNEISDLIGKQNILIDGESNIIETDLLGTNGVVHVIDSILPTESGLPITTALKNQNLTIFRELISAGNFENEFNSLSNVTFFVPSDKSFEDSKWKKKLEENPSSLKNNGELKEFLNYHIIEPMVKTCDLTENGIKTRGGDSLRVNLYSTHPIFTNIMNRATVNCARLIHFDDESCGSVIHQVDKVLEPANENLYQKLETNPNYSMFLRLVKEANLTDLIISNDQKTIFVPNNDVFREASEWYDDLLENKEKLTEIVKTHILPDVMCCAGIVASDWPFVRTVETINNVHLKLDRDRRPKVQNAGITKCDINASNGIIHEINDVISVRRVSFKQPPPVPTYW